MWVLGNEILGHHAYPAVTSMGIWGNKCQLSMFHKGGQGPGGILGTHTFTSETWTAPCRPAVLPRGFACVDF